MRLLQKDVPEERRNRMPELRFHKNKAKGPLNKNSEDQHQSLIGDDIFFKQPAQEVAAFDLSLGIGYPIFFFDKIYYF